MNEYKLRLFLYYRNMNKNVISGLENLAQKPLKAKDWGRLGLLYNQSSVDSNYKSAADVLSDLFPGRLKVLFGPQHGVWTTEQDNMIETGHQEHARLNIPIFSLYHKSRKPDPTALDMMDTVIVDLQDVGTRVYTFAVTVLYMLEECAVKGKKVVVLDRPNPVNGVHMEGNLLERKFESFVGPHQIPMRHAMTIAELALMLNQERNIGCDLEVLPMEGWKRSMFFQETGLPWVMPSPNMPCADTAIVYPGQVLLEGVNISEGRGTTKPFEIFGAPFIDPARILANFDMAASSGAILRETAFKPVFNKWANEVCRGFQIHVIDRLDFKPFSFTLELFRTLKNLYPDKFQWTKGPYEYEYDKVPIDIILGTEKWRKALDSGSKRNIKLLMEEQNEEIEQFKERRKQFIIYLSL